MHLPGIVEAFALVDRLAVDVGATEYHPAVWIVGDFEFEHFLHLDFRNVDLWRAVGRTAPVVEHDRLPAWPGLAADRGELPTV